MGCQCGAKSIKARGLCRRCYYTAHPKPTSCGHQPHHCAGLCSKCYEARRRRTTPDRSRNAITLFRFGITVAQYDELAKRGCSICGVMKNKSGKRLGVDHDHRTGRVRGLLCHPCNLAVGLLADDPARLRRAAVYVETADAKAIVKNVARLPWMRGRRTA